MGVPRRPEDRPEPPIRPAINRFDVTGTPRLPQAIVFDLDGTLVDTYRLYAECFRRTLAPYLGYAPSAPSIGQGVAPSPGAGELAP